MSAIVRPRSLSNRQWPRASLCRADLAHGLAVLGRIDIGLTLQTVRIGTFDHRQVETLRHAADYVISCAGEMIMKRPRLFGMMRMSEREYRANLDGMNIFFGAVLGIVLGGTEAMAPLKFAGLLAMSAGMVVSILYISSSRHRLAYAAVAVILIALLPRLLSDMFEPGEVSAHLQPTLAVWVAMVIGVEFVPREAPEPAVSPPG